MHYHGPTVRNWAGSMPGAEGSDARLRSDKVPTRERLAGMAARHDRVGLEVPVERMQMVSK